MQSIDANQVRFSDHAASEQPELSKEPLGIEGDGRVEVQPAAVVSAVFQPNGTAAVDQLAPRKRAADELPIVEPDVLPDELMITELADGDYLLHGKCNGIVSVGSFPSE